MVSGFGLGVCSLFVCGLEFAKKDSRFAACGVCGLGFQLWGRVSCFGIRV